MAYPLILSTIKVVRRIFLIFTILFTYYWVKPAFAAISFTISNPQYNNGEITIDVSVSGLTSTSCLNGFCYLQVAFTASELTRYFGFTKNHNGVWYEYIGSPESSYIQSTFFAFQPADGAWSGQISLKNNPNDPDYKGPGVYDVKAWRYSGKSNRNSGPSNILTVNIEDSVHTPTPTPSPTSTPTPTPVPASTPISTPTPQPTLTSSKKQSPTLSPTVFPSASKISSNTSPSPKPTISSTQISTVAGTQTSSPQAQIKNDDGIKNGLNPISFAGGGMIVAGVSILGYILFKNKLLINLWKKL